MEKRSHDRKSFDEKAEASFLTIEVQDQRSSRVKVRIIDFSAGGIGLECEEQIQVGQEIKFVEKLPEEETYNSGVVMWTMLSKDGYRLGVKFT
jgi:hypothetical protein